MHLLWRKQYVFENALSDPIPAAEKSVVLIPLEFAIVPDANRYSVYDLIKRINIDWCITPPNFPPGVEVTCRVGILNDYNKLTHQILSPEFIKGYLASKEQKDFDIRPYLRYVYTKLESLTNFTIGVTPGAENYDFNGIDGVRSTDINSHSCMATVICTLAIKLLNF